MSDTPATEQLAAVGPLDPSMITSEMKDVYVCMSSILLECGRRPSLEEIAEKTGVPVQAVEQIMDAFEGVFGIYRDPFFGHLIAAYPVAGIPTMHKLIRPEGGRVAYSPCAMDALTLGPTIERDVTVKSSCRYCDNPVMVSYGENGSKIVERAPDDIWIWVENRIPNNAPYYLIVCINTNFFCCKDHLDKWLAEEALPRSGQAYSLDAAFAATEQWCTYKMYKLVTEGRPWGGKALDEV